MNSEGGYWFVELIKLLLPLVPILVLLFVTKFLWRVTDSPSARWLVVITWVWLVVTIASRVTLSPVLGLRLFLPHTSASAETARAQMDFYFQLSSWLSLVEEVMFTIFAVALLLFCRKALSQRKPHENV